MLVLALRGCGGQSANRGAAALLPPGIRGLLLLGCWARSVGDKTNILGVKCELICLGEDERFEVKLRQLVGDILG